MPGCATAVSCGTERTTTGAPCEGPFLTVRLSASTRIRLTLRLRLRTRTPSYGTPFDTPADGAFL